MNQLNPDSLEQVAPASELQGQTKNGSLENRTLAREWHKLENGSRSGEIEVSNFAELYSSEQPHH